MSTKSKFDILLVMGTRPEAIKMCPLFNVLKSQEHFNVFVCNTGQHSEMIKPVFNAFNVVPDFDLNIMSPNQTLVDITNKILSGINKILKENHFDIVLVHGDTSTAFASSLACFYTQTRIAHVEAGLRTYNMFSPYPEEFNRQAIDLYSDIYFAPTTMARNNLLKEGKQKNKIFVTGNTGIDALKTTIKKDYTHEVFEWVGDSKLILITAHRRENLGQPMVNMFRAIKRVMNENKNVKAVYPIHLNPRVREIAQKELSDCDNIKIIEPLDVFDFHNFLSKSYFVLTDSGGIQEEAPALGKPVLVMRDTTERPEGLKAGTLKLTGTSEIKIYKMCNSLLKSKSLYKKMSHASNPYGDGYASERIAEILKRIL